MAKRKRDWLDDFIDGMSEEEKADLSKKDDARYYWSPTDEELYCWSDGTPTCWSVRAQAWVFDPECVDVMLGESFGRIIDAEQAEKYRKYLNKKYGKNFKTDDSKMVKYEPKMEGPLKLDDSEPGRYTDRNKQEKNESETDPEGEIKWSGKIDDSVWDLPLE
jgi:hypothetical protein